MRIRTALTQLGYVVHAHPNWETGENPDCTYSPIDGSPPGGWSPNKKLRIDNFRIARDTPKIPLPVPVLSVIAVLNNWQDSIERSFAG